MRQVCFFRPGVTGSYRYISLQSLFILLAVTIGGGCADIHDRTSLKSSFAPEATSSYLYGRFSLNPGSATSPRLFLKLFNVTTTEFLTIHLAENSDVMHLIDVAPGRYQFTQLLLVPWGAMGTDVRSDNLRLPPVLSFVGRPFDVEAGNAYYVGDWVGTLSSDVDYYGVFSRIKLRWGLYRLAFDLEGATAAMKRLYPSMELIPTRPAWRDHDRP